MRTSQAAARLLLLCAISGALIIGAVGRAEAVCSATLGSPSAGASINFPQTFTWSTSGSCSGLSLAFATSSNPSTVSVFSVSGTSISIDASQWAGVKSGIGTASTYYWTIGESGAGGFTARASFRSFSEGAPAPPPPPVAITPGADAAPGPSISATPTFQWSFVGNLIRYGFYVEKSPFGSSNRTYQNTAVAGTSLAMPAGLLSEGLSYRWQATAFNTVAESAGSNWLYFTVASSTANRPLISAVFPDPVTGSNSAQEVTVQGANFQSGCGVTLRDATIGQSSTPEFKFHSDKEIVVTFNFTTAAHDWTVEVTNPGGIGSGPFPFRVISPAVARPDLAPLFVNLDHTTAQPGSHVTVACDVENRGTAPAGASTTRLFLTQGARPAPGDPVLADLPTPQIAVQGSTSLNTTVRLPDGVATGTWYIVAQVDAGRVISQFDTSNDMVRSRALNISTTAACNLTCSAAVQASAPVNYPVTFSATLTGFSACGNGTVTWDFGDTTGGTGETTSHTYTKAGAYLWSMRATGGSQQCSKSGSIQIAAPPTTTLVGTVVNIKTGAAIRNAQLTVGAGTANSDASGAYQITGLQPDQYTARVTASGYALLTQTVIIPGGMATLRQDFQLNPLQANLGPIVMRSVQSKYRPGTFFLDGRSMVVPFRAEVDWAGRTPDAVLMTPTRRGLFEVPADATGATKSFDMGSDFGPCGALVVGARSADHALATTIRAPFTIMSRPLAGIGSGATFVDRGDNFAYASVQGLDFDFIDSKPIEIDDDVPLLGKHGPLSLRYLPTVATSIDSDGTAHLSTDFSNFPLGSHDKDVLEKVKGVIAGFDFSFEPKIDIGGTFRPDCRWHYEGSGGVSGAVSFKIVYYLPVTFPVYLSGRIDFSAGGFVVYKSVNLVPDSGEWRFEIVGRAAVGAGIADFLSAEGFGKVDGVLVLTTATPHKTLDLTFSAGVAVHFLLYTKEYTLAETRRHWSQGNPLRDASVWTESPERLVSRDYLTRSGYARFRPLAAGKLENGRTRAEALQSNVFPQSMPSLAIHPSDRVLAWVADSPSRSSVNRTIITASRYADGSWSEPAPVEDDGTADFHPAVSAAAAGSLMAWENEARVLPDGAASDIALQSLEISVAELPTGQNTWTKPRRITTNNYLDHSPRISGDGLDDAMVTWIANRSNDLNGSAANPNELWFARKTTNGWDAPQMVALLPYAVIRHTMLYAHGKGTVVLSVDEDNDVMTVDDRELVALTFENGRWSSPQRLTVNGIVDDSPTLVSTPAGIVLFWLRGGEISQCPGLDVASRTAVYVGDYSANLAAYRVAANARGSMAVVWAEPSAHDSDLQVVRYDAARRLWGAAQPLTDDLETEKYVALALADDGELIAVYDRGLLGPFSTSRVSATAQSPPVDLTLLVIGQRNDLAIEVGSFAIDSPNARAGAQIQLETVVRNLGTTTVSSFNVDFYESDPVAGAAPATSVAVSTPLLPGGAATIRTALLVPDKVPVALFAVVRPVGNSDDDSSNDAARLAFGAPDAALRARAERLGTTPQIVARVTNIGNVPSASTTVVVRDAASGTLLSSVPVPPLQPDQSTDVSVLVPQLLTPTVSVTVDESRAIGDINRVNNNTTVEVPPVSTARRRAVR